MVFQLVSFLAILSMYFSMFWARCQIYVGRATIKEYAEARDFMQRRDEEALGLHLKEAITF
jgi:hypothetical protein